MAGCAWRISVTLVVVLVLASALGEEKVRTRRDASPKRKLRVVSIETIPYTMKAKGYEGVYNASGVGYIGFIPDMLFALEKRLNLEIEFYMSPDGTYGRLNKNTNKWTGMIGEVMKKENNPAEGADMAAAPITMTAGREKVVDFIKSFQHHGITMLIKKPSNEPRNMWEYTFDIVKPLSAEVWVCCSIGVIVVGLLLWVNNRFNPYEWGGRHNLGRASESAAESFNLQGSLWFAFTSLQWQGFERAPRSLSSKTLTCFWFVFVTITLVTYTGSLVNHLFWASTVHGKDPTKHNIQTLSDLVNSPDYDYGFLKGGATSRYFSEIAEGEIFDKMRAHWKEKGEHVHVSSSEEGLNRVRREKYVYFCEKYSAEYYANLKPCDVMSTGGLLGHRAYGFAVPHNMDHQLSEDLHAAVLEMMEEGDVEALEHKWWNAKGECWDVMENERQISQQSALFVNKPKVIDLSMFWGALVLLCVGILITIVVAIAEIMFYKYKGRYERGNRPGESKLQMDDDAHT